MMKRAGIVRTKKLLDKQKQWLKQLNVNELTSLDPYSVEDIQAIFMYINAYLITEAALTRTESRGGHFRSDYPHEDEHWCKTEIIQKREGDVEIYYEQGEATHVN